MFPSQSAVYNDSVRNSTLDVLRAVAILLVFGRHSEGMPFLGRFGWIGVDLFFVLSGFLVSGLLFREYQHTRQLQAGRFLIRRGLKIYPQFYLLLTVTAAGMLIAGVPIDFKAAAAELAFFQNYTPGLWEYTWSLAVEEHFYLLLVLAFGLLARRGGEDPFRSLPKWIGSICVAIAAMRVATRLWNSDTSFYRHVTPSHLRMDSLLAGVLLAYCQSFRGVKLAAFARRFGGWLPLASIMMLAPVSFLKQSDPFIYTAGFTMVAVAFTLLMIGVLYPLRPVPIGAGTRAMAGLGRVSYAFYLWQGPIFLLDQRIKSSPLIDIPLTFAATLAIAWLTTRLLERPFLRLRDRWFPAELSPV